MELTLITVPYFLGRERVGMGSGPDRLLEQGASSVLRAAGHDVDVLASRTDEPFRHEIGASMEIVRRAAIEVRAARERGRLPIILAGNCHSCLGTLAGITGAGNAAGRQRTGIVWLDAHGDFNTPETTVSGYFDGMALSAATGGCWRALTGTIPEFEPVEEHDVVLIGARDIDPAERTLLERSPVTRITPAEARVEDAGPVTAALDALAERVDRVYVHIDMDVLDPSEGVANEFATADGLSPGDVERVLTSIRERIPIAAAAIAAYNPRWDADGKVARSGLRFLEAIARPAAAVDEAATRG